MAPRRPDGGNHNGRRDTEAGRANILRFDLIQAKRGNCLESRFCGPLGIGRLSGGDEIPRANMCPSQHSSRPLAALDRALWSEMVCRGKGVKKSAELLKKAVFVGAKCLQLSRLNRLAALSGNPRELKRSSSNLLERAARLSRTGRRRLL